MDEEKSTVKPDAVKAAESKADKKKIKKLEAEVAELKKAAEEAKKETEAANEKYLRMMAEYDNFRKRSAKEREGV